MKVEQLMSGPVVSCPPDASLADAATLMWNHDIGCVAVVDPEQRPIGMITDRDICMAALHGSRPLNSIRVSAAMSRDIASVRSGDSIQAAQEQMSKRQVRRLPVLDGGNKLVGMISVNDLTRASTGPTRAPEGIEPREIAQALAAIGKPRGNRPSRPRI
jgi:CBS domain-containing protein